LLLALLLALLPPSGNGFSKQLPPRPEDIAWVVIVKKASAQNTAAGAALAFKTCFVFIAFSLSVFLRSRESRRAHGMSESPRHRCKTKMKDL
jgi:hypothetical protein